MKRDLLIVHVNVHQLRRNPLPPNVYTTICKIGQNFVSPALFVPCGRKIKK